MWMCVGVCVSVSVYTQCISHTHSVIPRLRGSHIWPQHLTLTGIIWIADVLSEAQTLITFTAICSGQIHALAYQRRTQVLLLTLVHINASVDLPEAG